MEVEVNGLNINYEIDGPEGAPVIVFSHCLAANHKLWQYQIAEFKNNFRVLTYDIRGHGGSSAPEEAYAMQGLAEDIKLLLDRLGVEKCHFVGISLGGMIAQVFALNYPDRLRSVIPCDTVCRVPAEAVPVWEERIQAAETEGMGVQVEPTMQRWLTEGFRENNPAVNEQIKKMIENTPVPGFVGCCRAIADFDVCEEISNITVPTQVMVGENDPGTPVSEARNIQEKISGAKLEIIPGARHLCNIETASEFNRRLSNFLMQFE
ncbi:MAG: alpha/beta fold hydrolase [Thermodesulfobacteriota bacterium]